MRAEGLGDRETGKRKEREEESMYRYHETGTMVQGWFFSPYVLGAEFIVIKLYDFYLVNHLMGPQKTFPDVVAPPQPNFSQKSINTHLNLRYLCFLIRRFT